MKKGIQAIGAVLFMSFACAAQTGPPNVEQIVAKVRQYGQAKQHALVGELVEFLSIPNVAGDTANIQRNGTKLAEMLQKRGFEVQLLPIPGRGPVVFGELRTPGAKRTVVFYCHYDGQPVDPSRWTDTKPFEPALRTNSIEAGGKLIPFPSVGASYQNDWRIYARSASDDKSPIVAILAALDALRASGISPAVNLKVVFDGEEEDGSPNLEKALHAHKELLTGDLLISADGPVHQSGLPQVVFGNRGVVDLEITVYGPCRPLHSGHYGNWAPNPAMRLARLLASMKDDDGRVLVSGFYDDVMPLTEAERHAIAAAPPNDEELEKQLGFSAAEGGGKSLLELINLPSLNVRGLRSGWVGEEARTIVPDTATASLDLRLVKNVPPEKQVERVIAHIRKHGYYVAPNEPTAQERQKYPRIARVTHSGGYAAARTPMDKPVAQALTKVVREAVGGPVVLLPTSGGSVPMYIFENFGLPVIHVPIVNHDNNQHSPNENLQMGNFWRGMEIYAAVIAGLDW